MQSTRRSKTSLPAVRRLARLKTNKEGEQKMANEDRTVVVDADQYARLKPYLDIKRVSLASVINEALKDELDHVNAPTDEAMC
jgi:hypothetical protein